MGGFCGEAGGIHAGGGRMSGADGAVYVIVVNWNNAGDTIRCLESLSGVNVTEMRVLVVDNGSTDGSADTIRKRFPQYGLLELETNRMYGGGCNAGFELARKEGAEYVIFLNNDTVVDPGFLEPLISSFRDHDAVAITVPRIYYMDFPDRLWYAGGEVDLRMGRVAHRGIRKKDGERFDRACETEYATGCCLAMRVSDFSRFQGFDERFALYGEDVDLSLRVREAGKRVLYVPASRVWHSVSASGAGELDVRKLWRKNLSLLRVLAKHRAWPGMAVYLLLAPYRVLTGTGAVLLSRMKTGFAEPSEGAR